MHPTAAQVQQAAADQLAAHGSRWKEEVPTAGQLSAAFCELQDAWAHGMVVVPGERPTVWPVSQQTSGTQIAIGAQFRL